MLSTRTMQGSRGYDQTIRGATVIGPRQRRPRDRQHQEKSPINMRASRRGQWMTRKRGAICPTAASAALGPPSAPRRDRLARDDPELVPAVASAAVVGGVLAGRPLLAEARDLDPVGVDLALHQEALRRRRSALTEREVVLVGADI